MIESTPNLADYLGSLKGEFRAMDLEADSLHRYHEKLSLIQFTDGENHQLIDPLAIDDLKPLTDFLETAQLWMHGADYDIVLHAIQRSVTNIATAAVQLFSRKQSEE